MVRAGIIGGLGPEATVYYYRRLVSRCLEECGRRPRVVVYSIPLEEMCSAAQSGDVEAVGRLVAEAVEALAGSGAVVAVLSANTPHMAWHLFEPIARRVRMKLVHIAEPVAEWARESGASKLGLIATTGTIRHRVYHSRLEPLGVEIVTPPEDMQRLVDKAIEALASSGDTAAIAPLRAALDWLAGRADAVVLGCTDLSPYKDVLRPVDSALVIDSSDLHVDALVREVKTTSTGL